MTTSISKLTIKIPERVFVVVHAAEVDRISYMTAYEKNAPFKKRAEKLCKFAYDHSTELVIDHASEKVSITPGPGSTVNMAAVFIEKRLPTIIDNILISGFEVSKAVKKKAHWRSNDDVVWRIRDPRNFDVEISSGNFLQIVDHTTIINGKIQGNCIWAMDGNALVLLPENSNLYKEATAFTNKVEQKLTLRNVSPGDKIEIIASSVNSGAPTAVEYFGKFWFVQSEPSGGSEWSDIVQWNLASTQTDRQVVKYDNQFYALRTFKVLNILEKLSVPTSVTENAKLINSSASFNIITGVDYYNLVVPTKVSDFSAITIELVDEPTVYPKWGRHKYFIDQLIFNHDNNWYSPGFRSVFNTGSGYSDESVGYRINIDTVAKTKSNFLVPKKSTSRYNDNVVYERVCLGSTEFDMKTIKKYRLKFNYGDFSAIAYRAWR